MLSLVDDSDEGVAPVLRDGRGLKQTMLSRVTLKPVSSARPSGRARIETIISSIAVAYHGKVAPVLRDGRGLKQPGRFHGAPIRS